MKNPKGRLVLLTPGHAEPGGAQRRSRLLARGLCDLGWDVRVITRAGSLRRLSLRREPGLRVLEIPGFDRRRLGGAAYYALAFPIALAWGIRARAFVAVQLMSTTTVAAGAGGLLRKPFVALATTSGELGEIRYLKSTRLARLRLKLLRRAGVLVGQTSEVASELREETGCRVAVLPNPVELPPEPPPLDGEPRFLYTGRLSEEKDLFTLLAAWKTLLRRFPRPSSPLPGRAAPSGRWRANSGSRSRATTLCARA